MKGFGIDVSHWQGIIRWDNVEAEYTIIKATEGTTFFDQKFLANKSGARAHGILCGYYHFARGGDAKAEAEYFVKKVGDIREGEFLVLDWEIPHASPVAWCKAFLDHITALVGFRPLIYTNYARVLQYDWSPVVAGNYGLWVARYPKPDFGIYVPLLKPGSGKWPFWVLWQYSSKGKVPGVTGNCDMNILNGDLAMLKKYGKPGEPAPACNHQCPLHCTQ